MLDVSGSGPAVVCLHGVSANRSTWSAVARRLGDGFTVLAPDLLGRGDSDLPTGGAYRLDDELRRAAELLRRAGLVRAVTVGHSHGAAIALGLAARMSGVAGLVLVNPVTPWSVRPAVLSLPGLRRSRLAASALARFRKPVTRYILERRVLGPGTRASRELVDRYAAPYAAPHRARALLAVVADWDPRELRPWISTAPIPALVLAGACDRRMTVEHTARLADRIGAAYVVAAGAGHALPEERPGLVADAIAEIAGRLELPAYEFPAAGPSGESMRA